MDDIVINKIQTIKNCIKRINEEYDEKPKNLENFTKLDALTLNIQRACEACIDIAMHIVSEKKLGIPQNSRDVFEYLYIDNILDKEITAKMKAMVGFRNIAIHDYQAMNLEIVRKIIENHIVDFENFSQIILNMNKV
jgi:uncharacterized protein YutE (UPF0331/DUF86 family)